MRRCVGRGTTTDLTRTRRRGGIVPILGVFRVSMCGFVALAVDVGMVAVARTQAQNAADSAALAGARTLDGSPTANLALATASAQQGATSNKVLSAALKTTDVTVTHGTYH